MDVGVLCFKKKPHSILFFAARDIQQDEELTIANDYDSESELNVCLCGSEKCRGYLNEAGDNR